MRTAQAMTPDELLTGLPGEALVRRGLEDLAQNRLTVFACLAAIGSSRLSRAGLITDSACRSIPEPELQLYRLLRLEGGDAYSRYNALLRELVSFESGLDRRGGQMLKR